MNYGKVYLFLDESGDLGRSGGNYFCIAAISTTSPRSVELVMKRIRQRKLRKHLKQLPELKANNSDKAVREKVLVSLHALPSVGFCAVLVDKRKIHGYLFDKKDELYNYIAGVLMSSVDLRGYKDVELVYDRKTGNKLFNSDFENYLEKKLLERKYNVRLEIKGMPSEQHKALMAVDFVAWSVYRKFNWQDESYFKIIEDKTDVIRLWE